MSENYSDGLPASDTKSIGGNCANPGCLLPPNHDAACQFPDPHPVEKDLGAAYRDVMQKPRVLTAADEETIAKLLGRPTMTTFQRADGKDIGDYTLVMNEEYFTEDEEGAWVIKTEWSVARRELLWLGPIPLAICEPCKGEGVSEGGYDCPACEGEGTVRRVPPKP